MIDDETDARNYVLEFVKKQNEGSPHKITDVTIENEKIIDDHKYWEYIAVGIPLPATRSEKWIRDDGKLFSIFGCFEHQIEQVVHGEVSNPNHNGKDDQTNQNNDKTQIAQIALEKLRFTSIEEAERNLVLIEGVGYSCYNPELRGTAGIFGFNGGFLMYGGMNATTEDAIESYKQGSRS